MKKLFAVLFACLLAAVCIAPALALDIDYASLTDAELEELIREATAERSSRNTVHVPAAVKASPDKYTWYVQDYVGRNAAGFGYTSLGGDRLERYGAGYLEFIFVTEDGTFIDIEDEAILQKYVVTGQNIAPNTEMKYVYRKDSSGKEYSNLIDFQSIRYIDLTVRRMDGTVSGNPVTFELVPITPSPDKYTHYMRNYVGKNVASFGYTSLGGDRRDEYGQANIRLNLVADDGSYLDPENMDILKQYVVVSQDVAPNSLMKLTYRKNSRGEEYSNLIDSQTYESITLYVHKLGTSDPESSAAIKTDTGDTGKEKKLTITVAAKPTDAPAQADGKVMSYRDVRYRYTSDGKAEICGYTKAQSTITIPSEIDGRTVTRIADSAFENCTALKSLINWADLEYIGASAFKGCTGLKDISIPGETTFIGESAFEGCTSLKTVIMWGDPVSIGKNTFKNCSRLTDISLPSSVTFIGESAFENCSNMSSVIIWGDITRIERNAFKNCKSLDDVSIPSSCEVIEESAFQECTDLDTVLLWGDTNIGNYAFQGCSSLEEISISSGTDYIGDYAFEGCSSLENVLMWGRSTKIGRDAFSNCPKLKRVPR